MLLDRASQGGGCWMGQWGDLEVDYEGVLLGRSRGSAPGKIQ